MAAPPVPLLSPTPNPPRAPLRPQAQVAEVAAVSAHFANPTGLAATGATIAGVKYMFVRGEENAEIYVKKVPITRATLAPDPPSRRFLT